MSTTRIKYHDSWLPAERGERLLDTILRAGIDHRHLCGGRGFCTSCRVEVLEGSDHLSSVSSLEIERLGPDAGKLRLACQTRVFDIVQVRVARAISARFSLNGD